MRKLVVGLLVVSVGIIGLQGVEAATGGRTAAPLTTVGNSSVTGNYSVLFTFHDAQHQQDGNGAGTLTFDGGGHISGVISEQSRCLDVSPTTPCGNAANIRAPIVSPSNYIVNPDGSATLDICLHLTYVVGTQGGTPGNANQYVEFTWEGAFSAFFFHGKFIQTLLKPVPATATSCDSTPWVQTPNVVTADLERV